MLQEGNIISNFSLKTDQGEFDNVFKYTILLAIILTIISTILVIKKST